MGRVEPMFGQLGFPNKIADNAHGDKRWCNGQHAGAFGDFATGGSIDQRASQHSAAIARLIP
jgi:hypothetical protein